MFSALLFSPDARAIEWFDRRALESREVTILKSVERYPQPHEMVRLLNACAPDMVLLDLADWEQAAPLVTRVRSWSLTTAVIGFGGDWGTGQPPDLAETGLTELLSAAVEGEEFRKAIYRAMHKVRPEVEDNLVTFVPAKAGSGCTTVVLNVAGALAAAGQKVTVLECDFRSGVLGVLINATPAYSLLDALSRAGELDYSLWMQHVTQAMEVDFVLAKLGQKAPPPSWSDCYALLRYAKARYKKVLVDLPERAEEAPEEIVRRSGQVCCVCTPDLPSLTLARRRCEELGELGLNAGRIAVVVNRWREGGLKASDIEEFIGCPVVALLEEDYNGVYRATVESRLVAADSPLGRSVATFARRLAGLPAPAEEPAAAKSPLGFLRKLRVKAGA